MYNRSFTRREVDNLIVNYFGLHADRLTEEIMKVIDRAVNSSIPVPEGRSKAQKKTARKVQPKAGTVRAKVLALLAKPWHRDDGLTCEAVVFALQGKHQTISARLNELEKVGWVERDRTREVENRSGGTANPYVITEAGLNVVLNMEVV